MRQDYNIVLRTQGSHFVGVCKGDLCSSLVLVRISDGEHISMQCFGSGSVGKSILLNHRLDAHGVMTERVPEVKQDRLFGGKDLALEIPVGGVDCRHCCKGRGRLVGSDRDLVVTRPEWLVS